MELLIKGLPPSNSTTAYQIAGYGHMDFLWDPDAVTKVYVPYVLPLAAQYLPITQ